ncbi:hypothetical protein M569_06532, partial [Genlisea aurea]
AEEGSRTARLPRWTKQEILVLIQGKRVAENRVRRGRVSGSGFGGASHIEPKWSSVSSYCEKHGVNRGPVQCRKRWSNLAGDFKKVKEWESRVKDEAESFWVMRNDLRRERKLPGYFDREVYDILDGNKGIDHAKFLGESSSALLPAADVNADDPVTETLFDSGRSAAADDGLFSDSEQPGREEPGQSSGKRKEAVGDIPAPIPISGNGPSHDRSIALGEEEEEQQQQQGRKRKRYDSEGEKTTSNIEHRLVAALEKNGRLLSSQLEAQNSHLQLDREQRNEHFNGFLTVLNKLGDALSRIADKL